MLLGTEFYAEPPFKVERFIAIEKLPKYIQQDYEDMQNFCTGPGNIQKYSRIKNIVERYPHIVEFQCQFAFYLLEIDKFDEAEIWVNQLLEGQPEVFDYKIAKSIIHITHGQIEEANDAVEGSLADYKNLRHRVLTNFQFMNFCKTAIIYHIENDNRDKVYEIYSWTLDDFYDSYNKHLAGLIASFLVKPMPESFEEAKEEFGETNEDSPLTYFDFVDLNEKPYHRPFEKFHTLYLDEISLQDVRAVEA